MEKKRTWIKVSEPNNWKQLSVYVWESNNGAIPKGYVVHHRDGDPLNDDVDNLQLVTRREHVEIHRAELFAKRPSLTHEKEKTCPDCGFTWTGRGSRICRCESCCVEKNKVFQREYKIRKKKRTGLER